MADRREPGAVRYLPCGDTALTVEFGDRIDRALSARVIALDHRLARAALAGIVETVPTPRSLTVHFDPLAVTSAELVARLGAMLGGTIPEQEAPRELVLPVCYEPAFALDLAEVTARTGLTAHEVVRMHVATDFYVYMIGFLPGHPYMGDLPEQLILPRRETPRTAVPAGSVAIAVGMTAIYPFESPGGWHVIGRTPRRLFRPECNPPGLLRAGDRVRCVAVDRADFDRIAAEEAAGMPAA